MTDKEDKINKPNHYVQGRKFEPIHVIRDWELNFALGNAVKYISRAGRKVEDEFPGSEIAAAIQDLKKAAFYVQDEISALEVALAKVDLPKKSGVSELKPAQNRILADTAVININGKFLSWPKTSIYFHEIVSEAVRENPNPDRTGYMAATVKYKNNKNNINCTLLEEGHWAEVEDGMVINCFRTDKA
jgi:hypothetical protein